MADNQNSQQVKVRYSETSALFASQFLINTTSEDIILNFSSGAITDPASGETLLPVHSRIAMTPAAAHRLHQVLGSILAQQQAGGVPAAAQAQLPKVQQ